MRKFYTGVGSRETPGAILDVMRELARVLAEQGWTLRSGGADGADKAFEDGWWDYVMSRDATFAGSHLAELYIPWEGFNEHTSTSHNGVNIITPDSSAIMQRAYMRASCIHPAWEKLKPGAKKLHGRNVFQVMGKDLDTPSKFVVAYSKLDRKGEPTGGTRTAIKLAEAEGIEVINLYKEYDLQRIEAFLEGDKL